LKPTKHELTPTYRDGKLAGWVKRINGKPKWICSAKLAPTPEAADAYYERHFSELWVEPEREPAPPPESVEAMVITDLANVFLSRKRARVGQAVRGIEQGTYDEYEEALAAFCEHCPDPKHEPHRTIGETAYRDLTPGDFGSFHSWVSGRYGIDRAKKYIIAVRSLFKLLAQPPMRLQLIDYGDQFPLPSRKDVRVARKRHREMHGVKAFAPAEIKAQLHGRPMKRHELQREKARRDEKRRGLKKAFEPRVPGASAGLKAMILLGVNCGFGNTDLGELPLPVVNDAMKTGWVSYTRGKTGTDRLALLWPETREAIRDYLAVRPAPAKPGLADLLFLTPNGLPYVTDTKDQVSFAYARLLERLGQQQLGRSFYALRRTYRSVAAEVGKELAIDLSMGHADNADDMSKLYTVRELRAELKKISAHVRRRFLSAITPPASSRRAA
jgi:integrase